MTEIRVRRSVRELQDLYDAGEVQPLEDLLRAWKGIKELAPDDPNSFFMIGGYHGEPFTYRDSDRLYWGGYCNHGNVLFPTWHRVYLIRLENALRTIVPTVTMPYWDETSAASLDRGIPSILTDETVVLDGERIPNPLRSFVLPEAMTDDVNQPSVGNVRNLYAKPKGYETQRFPRSGLVGTPEARAATEAHNAKFGDADENTVHLNDNVTAWLRGGNPTPTTPNPTGMGIYGMYENCLDAPNYTVFSNSTSAANYSKHNHPQKALEDPHNDIHIAIGGLDVRPYVKGQPLSGQIAGANGDMGENNTAALDPIFFFHHCNVDRMFWIWQTLHDAQDEIEIIVGDPGANSSASQGPTPGYEWDEDLTVESPLYPFTKPDGSNYTSLDCVNIERQLGYRYSDGSLVDGPLYPHFSAEAHAATARLEVSGIDRSRFEGSFVLLAYATTTSDDGAEHEYYLGHHSVLSRGNITSCANCLTHLEVVAHFSLAAIPPDEVATAAFDVRISARHDVPDDLEIHMTLVESPADTQCD